MTEERRQDRAEQDPQSLLAWALPELPEVEPGADLAALIHEASRRADLTITDGDVVVVASKVVAKAEGRLVPRAERSQALARESVALVAERSLPDGRTTRVVRSRSGPVLANAGLDESDVPPGTVLLLPADPDASARALRARLSPLLGACPAVLITDTSGRPWRDGVTDFALGAAGLECLDDARGRLDRFGRRLEVTVRAVGDEVAALADLVKGKAAGRPVAVVRGAAHLVREDDGPGAGACVRVGPGDWFALGHVEAVRASLGVRPAEVPPPPLDTTQDALAVQIARCVQVATAGSAPAGAVVEVRADGLVVRGPAVAAGMMAQRLLCALWAESLTGVVGDGGGSVPGQPAAVTIMVAQTPPPGAADKEIPA